MVLGISGVHCSDLLGVSAWSLFVLSGKDNA